jgi:hypothetical protein
MRSPSSHWCGWREPIDRHRHPSDRTRQSGPRERGDRVVKRCNGLPPQRVRSLCCARCLKQVVDERSALVIRALLKLRGVSSVGECLLESPNLNSEGVAFGSDYVGMRISARSRGHLAVSRTPL